MVLAMLMCYPGHFAPASLKPADFASAVGCTSTLSGAFRPGLIEANRATTASCSYRLRYPGHFAPASLKHVALQPPGRIDAPLSGAFRPGLIEAIQGGRRGLGIPQLSGAFRPGLIEAPSRSDRHTPASPSYTKPTI